MCERRKKKKQEEEKGGRLTERASVCVRVISAMAVFQLAFYS